MFALWLYYRQTHVNLWIVLDNIAIATPITACFIRLGNLIARDYRQVTDVPWAFVSHEWTNRRAIRVNYTKQSRMRRSFHRVVSLPQARRKGRHGLLFRPLPHADIHLPLLHRIHQRHSGGIESGMALDMGQILSIPFVIVGIACMVGGKWMKKIGAK